MAKQKLVLPINQCRITSGYKNTQYKREFGFNHYGMDMTDKNRKDFTVWGCGKGTVLEADWDASTGWTVVIQYDECILTDGTVRSLIQRSWHFDKVYVKKGQKITKDTKIGLYGDTGKYASGKHLHIEFDTDCNYPTWSPSFSKSTTIIKAGTDSTIHPNRCLYVKKTSPDYQSVIGSSTSNCWSQTDIQFKTY